MKFQLTNGSMLEVRPEIMGQFHYPQSLVFIIDVKEIKNTLIEMKKNWFGNKGVLREGIFWTAFMSYIFPWFLDIAKVYCAIMVCKAFYEERSGGRDGGRTGFQALVHYGKWLIIFHMIPFFAELVGQIGSHMRAELMNGGIKVK